MSKLKRWRDRAKKLIGRRAKDAIMEFVHVPVIVEPATFESHKHVHGTLTLRRITQQGGWRGIDYAIEFRITRPDQPGDVTVFVVHHTLPKLRLLWGFFALCGLVDNEVFCRVVEFLDSPTLNDVAEFMGAADEGVDCGSLGTYRNGGLR